MPITQKHVCPILLVCPLLKSTSAPSGRSAASPISWTSWPLVFYNWCFSKLFRDHWSLSTIDSPVVYQKKLTNTWLDGMIRF